MLGVDDFKDSSVTLKFRIKTVPLKQWEVGRELRRRIKRIFDAAGHPHSRCLSDSQVILEQERGPA